jgi:hypothetical protein
MIVDRLKRKTHASMTVSLRPSSKLPSIMLAVVDIGLAEKCLPPLLSLRCGASGSVAVTIVEFRNVLISPPIKQ